MAQINSDRLSGREREMRAAASKWLIELETASSVEALWPRFQAWLAEDPEHKIAYLRAERAWHALDTLREACPRETAREADLLLRPHHRRNALWWTLTIVAILAALVAAVLSRI